MPNDKRYRPKRQNDKLMTEDIEEFYATIPDGEYPVSEIQKMKPHPIQVSVESPPPKRQAKQRVFKGKHLEPTPIKPSTKPAIESHHASEIMMVFEGGKLVAFRYPDGTRRKVTHLHTEDD